MKIVLTGGTGLVGGAIARRLASAGHAVVVLSRSPRADADGIRYLAWDGRTSESWETEIAGAGAVMNLAGESVGSRWTRAKKERIAGSRVDATRAIVRAISSSASRPTVLINASAVGYYGNVPEGEVTETTPPGNDLLGRTCVAWEAEARKAEQFGVRVVMLRTGFVIAREAEAFQRLILPYKLFVGGPLGSGRQWFSWIHLDDVVAGYVFALEHSKLSGPVNLLSPNPVRVKQLAKELGRVLRRPSFFPAPAFALKIVLGEMSDLLLKGQKAIPTRLKEHGFVFKYPLLEEALRASIEPGGENEKTLEVKNQK